MQLPMPRLMPATTQTCDLSGFTPLSHPTASPCAARQSTLPTTWWFHVGRHTNSHLPERLPSEPAAPPFLSEATMTLVCLSALPDPAVSPSETVYLTSLQFSCKSYLWRDVGVKLQKDLVCTTWSWAPVSGDFLSGKDKPTYKMVPGSEGESFRKAALGI